MQIPYPPLKANSGLLCTNTYPFFIATHKFVHIQWVPIKGHGDITCVVVFSSLGDGGRGHFNQHAMIYNFALEL